mmetsp:Transcript_33333/g.94441  ORF Transcript_33333/g.94441 Transcript_33333/m.94441 type:complete len:292 (-) Transcript_33333:35-910(-)
MIFAAQTSLSNRPVMMSTVSGRAARPSPRALRAVPYVGASRAPHSAPAAGPVLAAASRKHQEAFRQEHEAPTSTGMEFTKIELAAASLAAPLLLGVGEASASGGEFGLLEGRSAALLHPIGMAFLFGSTLYAGYLGWQWRQLREVGAGIKAKKAELPPPGEDGKRPSSPLDGEIAALEEQRKTLAAGNFKDRHTNWGSLLLSMGVLLSVEGGLNTFLRAGKLFPGPHLFAGATITVLWALAAALVPYMQKGNDTARSLHIALNSVNVALFAWQLPTGWEIVLKVFQFTKWP